MTSYILDSVADVSKDVYKQDVKQMQIVKKVNNAIRDLIKFILYNIIVPTIIVLLVLEIVR